MEKIITKKGFILLKENNYNLNYYNYSKNTSEKILENFYTFFNSIKKTKIIHLENKLLKYFTNIRSKINSNFLPIGKLTYSFDKNFNGNIKKIKITFKLIGVSILTITIAENENVNSFRIKELTNPIFYSIKNKRFFDYSKTLEKKHNLKIV